MRIRRTAPLIALVTALSGCTVAGRAAESGAEPVVVGYQSKTINTVTAGTLLRAQGFFEKRLAELSRRTGKKYAVTWQDYDTGAPITAQMMAGKLDIGSMGDYPPFGALDAQTRAAMQRLLVDVLRTTGATVVFVTHDVDEAVFIGDRVAVLRPTGVHTMVDVPQSRDPATRGTPVVRAARSQILAALGADDRTD